MSEVNTLIARLVYSGGAVGLYKGVKLIGRNTSCNIKLNVNKGFNLAS